MFCLVHLYMYPETLLTVQYLGCRKNKRLCTSVASRWWSVVPASFIMFHYPSVHCWCCFALAASVGASTPWRHQIFLALVSSKWWLMWKGVCRVDGWRHWLTVGFDKSEECSWAWQMKVSLTAMMMVLSLVFHNYPHKEVLWCRDLRIGRLHPHPILNRIGC